MVQSSAYEMSLIPVGGGGLRMFSVLERGSSCEALRYSLLKFSEL